MKKFDLNALKNQFKTTTTENTNSGGGNYYPFWAMEPGESATVRFLPDLNEENPLQFLVEKLTHTLYINGEKKIVPCLKMYGEDCPICKVSAAYYKAGDKENGKRFWRSKLYLANVLVVEDPTPANKETGDTFVGKVKPVSLGTKIYDAIKEEFESGSFDEVPFDFYEGTNFLIKKTKSGEYADYSRSRFERKPSALDEGTIALVEESLVDLLTLLPAKPALANVEALLQAALNGESIAESNSGAEQEPEEAATPISTPKAAASAATTKAKAVPAAAPEEANDDGEDDDAEAKRILAQLKARRTQNAG